MDKNTLVSKLKERIAVEGRQSIYNPLLQKPTMLNPIGPGSYPGGLGGYAYIGPPPDFGGSYGAYEDAGGRKQVGIKTSKMFSIHDGSPAQLHAELSPEERQALMTQLEEASESHKCPSCRSELMISMPMEIESVHCPHCGSGLEGAAEKIKQCVSKLQEKSMSKASTKIVKASELTQVAADPAKEAMKANQPKDMGADVKPEKANMIEPSNSAKSDNGAMKELEGHNNLKKANEGKLKSDHNANGVQSGGIPVAASTDAEKAANARRERIRAALAKKNASKTEGSLALDAKTRIAAKREFRIMATFEPAKFEALKKNAKLAPLCAEVEKKLYTPEQRATIRAELKALASENAEAAAEMKKKLEFVAPEILMEEDMDKKPGEANKDEKGAEAAAAPISTANAAPAEAAAPAAAAAPMKAEGEGDMSGDMGAEAAAAPGAEGHGAAAAAAPGAGKEESEEEKAKKAKAMEAAPAAPEAAPAEAMQTEFLASLDKLEGHRVEMSLYGEESENPFWNLTVDSEPVGRIYLADQQDASSIRASFMSDAYAQNFGSAIGQVGVQKMLALSKARIFAHQVDETASTARIRDTVRADIKAEMDAKIGTLRQDFMAAVTTAMVGADKNYFQGEGAHELKSGLFNAIVQAGLESQSAVKAIEVGFDDAPAYWQFVMAKAVELMDMPKDARESLEKSILASGKIEIQVQADPASEEQQVMARLLKDSVNTIAKGGVVSGEDRKQIATRLGFAGRSR